MPRDADTRLLDLTRELEVWREALKPLYEHWETMWEQWYVRELPRSDPAFADNPFLSNERVHLPFQVVETMVPRVVGSEPRIAYRALDFSEDEPVSHLMGGLATWETKRMRLELELRDFVRQGEITGYSVAKHGWIRRSEKVKGTMTTPHYDEELMVTTAIEEEVEEETVIRNEGFFETINVLDFVYPLSARRMESCSAVWQRRWVTLGEIRELGRLGVYKNTDQVTGGAEGAFKSSRERIFAAQGITLPGSDVIDIEDDRSLVELWERWTNKTVTAIANPNVGNPTSKGENANGVVLRDDPNPLAHGEKPFLDFSPVPHPFQMHGIGLVQLVYDTTASLNTLRRQRRDAVTYTINPAWKGRGGLDANRVRLAPGFYLELGDLEDIEPLTSPDVNFASAQFEEERMREDVQEVTGAFTYLQGAPNAAGTTATEVATVTSEGNKRIAEQIKQLNERTMIPLARQLASNLAQFISVETAIRFSDLPDQARAAWLEFARAANEGQHVDEPNGLVMIDPDWLEVKGRLEPVPEIGQDAELSKVQRRSDAIQFVNSVAPVLAAAPNTVNLQEMVRWLGKQFDVRRTDIDALLSVPAQQAQTLAPPPSNGSGPSGDNRPLGGALGQPAVAGA